MKTLREFIDKPKTIKEESPKPISKTITITGNPAVIERFEMFLQMVYDAGKYGHSATFGFSLDGDGGDFIDFKGLDKKEYETSYHDNVEYASYKSPKDLEESAPPGKDAEDWIKANKEEFKKQYGDDYEKYLYGKAWTLFGEDISTTDGVSNNVTPLKLSDFAGYKCIHMDSDEYHKCVNGKVPYERWNKYITDEARCASIKEVFSKNQNVIARCDKTGAMSILKRKVQ